MLSDIHRGEHHQAPLNFGQPRTIKPTHEEERDGALSVQVVFGWCGATDPATGEPCRKRFIYSRYEYSGGWGPVHRHRDGKVIAAMLRRLKEAKESDWVLGSCPESYMLKKVLVR